MPGDNGQHEAEDDGFLYSVIDRLIQELADPERAGELREAREQFEKRRGQVREDESLWELWTQGFLEWFALDGPRAPVLQAYHEADEPKVRAALAAWLRSQTALVEIEQMRPGRVRVRDLLRGGLFDVSEKRSLHGVEVGDICEVRLIGFEGRIRFGRTFVFHPHGTHDALATQIAGLRDQGARPEQILDHAARLRLRSERYSHVAPERLYRSVTEEI